MEEIESLSRKAEADREELKAKLERDLLEIDSVFEENLAALEDGGSGGKDSAQVLLLRQTASRKRETLRKEAEFDLKRVDEELKKEERRCERRVKRISKLSQIPLASAEFSGASLKSTDLGRLVVNGFLHCPGLVPRALCERVLRLVNFELGRFGRVEGNGIPAGGEGEQRRPPRIECSAQLLQLFYHSPLYYIMRSLVGDMHTVFGGHVWTAWPGHHCTLKGSDLRYGVPPFSEEPAWEASWTVDGIDGSCSPPSTCSLLALVALSDMQDTRMGNLCVLPGGHTTVMHACHSGRVLTPLMQGEPGALEALKAEVQPSLTPPLQLTLQAGDVVFVPNAMPMLRAPHIGAHPTSFAVFRIYSGKVPPDTFVPEYLADCWSFLDGSAKIREIAHLIQQQQQQSEHHHRKN